VNPDTVNRKHCMTKDEGGVIQHRPLRFMLPLLLPFLLSGCGQDTKQRHPPGRDLMTMEEPGPKPVRVARPDSAAQISEYIRVVFQDRDGVFWYGTNDDGVCRYDGVTYSFLTAKDGFSGKAVRGIAQDARGDLWFATDSGVCRYDGRAFSRFTTADGLGDNDVWSLLLDRKGVLWCGTTAGVFRLVGKRFRRFPLPAATSDALPRFSRALAWCIVEDRDGNHWFGMDGAGARKWDGRRFTTYTVRQGLAHDNVRAIAQDASGRLWFGTWGGGLSRFDGRGFTGFTTRDGLCGDDIWILYSDSHGALWIGTMGAGVCRFDGTRFTAFTEKQGLTKNHVQSILEDRDGTMWFGFSGGLFRLEGERLVNVPRR
jgi:ligand-binding sensor domain-containing protein